MTRRTASAMPALPALRAEFVFGALVIVRHRTIWFVVALAAVVVAVQAVGVPGVEVSNAATALFVAGSFAVVAAALVLARGPALDAVRRAAAPWWQPPVGRLGAVVLLTLVMTATAALAVGAGTDGAARITLAAIPYAAALAALVAALAPASGATAAGVLGLLTAWLGTIPPSNLASALAAWPYLAAPAVTAWNVLPLEWRAARWIREGGWEDPMLLAVWIAGGVALAAWRAAGPSRRHPPRAEELAVLECHDVHAAYGSGRSANVALRGVSFGAEAGEIVALVGPDGERARSVPHVFAPSPRDSGTRIRRTAIHIARP